MYWDHRKGPGGPPDGATYPGGPHGLKWEGNQPLVGCAPPHAPRVGNHMVGGLPTCLGGQGTPPGRRPPSRWDLGRRPPLPGGLYKGGREGSSTTALGASLLPCYTSPSRRNSAKPCREPLHPPPRRRAAGSPSTSPPPCWIKKEETSLHRTCVERGGAVRSALGHR